MVPTFRKMRKVGHPPSFRLCRLSKAFGHEYNAVAESQDFSILAGRCVMKLRMFMLTIMVVAPVFGFSQSPNPKPHQTITGCLMATKTSHEYRLVDEKGVANIVYSVKIHLDSYVGQSVTLVGNQSATPSTDEGTGRPAPHFKVVEVKPASGTCK